MVGGQSQEPDDHNEDEETTDQEKPLPAPCGNRRPRLLRVRLPQHVVPVEVPRPKAHRVELVLPSMSVSGHRLAMCSCHNRLARRHAAHPGDDAEQVRGHGSKSVRECSNDEPPSPWAWTDVRFRPCSDGTWSCAADSVWLQIGPFVLGRRDRPAGGDRPTESVLWRAAVGGLAHQGYHVFPARRRVRRPPVGLPAFTGNSFDWRESAHQAVEAGISCFSCGKSAFRCRD